VKIPGEKLAVRYVTATNGDPVLLPSIAPGAVMVFPRNDAKVPAQILVRRHPLPGKPTSAATIKVTPKPVATGKKSGTVAFEIPQLPAGVYDAWYTDGQPAPAPPPKDAGATLPAPAPKASQFVTFEVHPELRPAHAVVRGTPGSEIDVAVGVAGPPPTAKAPISVTLTGFNDVIQLAPSGGDSAVIGSDGLAHFKVLIASDGDAYLAAKSPGYASVAIRVVGAPQYKLRTHRLKPGDVLLCQGRRTQSELIQLGERIEIGSANPLDRPWYSHVAVYLGEGNAAEMLDEGLVKHKLEDTLDGCTTLDVYRRVGITPAQQKSVVDSIRAYDAVPYAWFQIGVLGSAGSMGLALEVESNPLTWLACGLTIGVACATAAVWVHAKLETSLRLWMLGYVASDHARNAMICSELATWAYRDAGASPEVAPWWQDLESHGVLLLPEARTDFTTPNMIAHSKDMDFVFQLWPPLPAAKIVGGQIRLGENVEFETGSAVLGQEDEDLLEEVAKLLKKRPEIKRVRVEGHTDNVGEPADNQALSERRAKAVVKWLVEHGIDATRLTSVGFGEDRPLRTNDEEHNRRKNRRVEFHVESTGQKP
jgi:outer membrane protein OmpA-like peptidoglycan-associated protein